MYMINQYLKNNKEDEALELLSANLSVVDESTYPVFEPLITKLLKTQSSPELLRKLIRLETDPLKRTNYLKQLFKLSDDEDELLEVFSNYLIETDMPVDGLFLYRLLEEKRVPEDKLKRMLDEVMLSMSDTSTTLGKIKMGILYVLKGEYNKAESMLQSVYLSKEKEEEVFVALGYTLFAYTVIDKYLRGKTTTSILIPKKSLQNAERVLEGVPESDIKKRVMLYIKYLKGFLSELMANVDEAFRIYNELKEIDFWDVSERLQILELRLKSGGTDEGTKED